MRGAMPGGLSAVLFDLDNTLLDRNAGFESFSRELYRTGRFPQAAVAFERFVECYPRSIDAGNIRLLLGIIYARDLNQLEAADKYLTKSMETLRDQQRKDQCVEWLGTVRSALGRPAPEV